MQLLQALTLFIAQGGSNVEVQSEGMEVSLCLSVCLLSDCSVVHIDKHKSGL